MTTLYEEATASQAPPTIKSKKVAGFQQHGVKFKTMTSSQCHGVCVFCGKEKFYCNPETGLWDCKVCGLSGNFEKFLTLRADYYVTAASEERLTELANSRGLQKESVEAWGVGYDPETKTYMIPMTGNKKREVADIHRYILGETPYGTSGATPQFMMPNVIKDSGVIHLVEGEWDGMAMTEIMEGKEDVVAAPGALNFPKSGLSLFQNRDVRVYYDNDRAGNQGTIKVAKMLQHVAKSIMYLHWPQDIGLCAGFDVRDLFISRGRQNCLKFFSENLRTAPYIPPGGGELEQPPPGFKGSGRGVPHHKVVEQFREWLDIKNPEILEVMFGAIFANLINVDPLWLFLVGPPGSCKTELIRALEASKRIESVSTLTPATLISGWNTGGEDPSLIPKLNGKILTIKDFTPILNMNQISRDAIFDILRDSYDGKVEKPFGNGVGIRRYKSRFGILAGVTPAIESFSTTNNMLGERFLKYTIRQVTSISVGREVIQRAVSNMRKETSMREQLCKVATETVDREITEEDIPAITPEVSSRIQGLAQFVAVLRGVVHREKYTGLVLAKPSHEIGTRIAKQLAALAMGIAIYRNENYIGADTMKVVQRVACDTVPDRVEELVRQMYIHGTVKKEGGKFHSAKDISEWCGLPYGTIVSLLNDLNLLGVTKKGGDNIENSGIIAVKWCLGGAISRLIEQSNLYAEEVNHARKVHSAKQEYGGRGHVRGVV